MPSTETIEITYRLRGEGWRRRKFRSDVALELWLDTQDDDIEVRYLSA